MSANQFNQQGNNQTAELSLSADPGFEQEEPRGGREQVLPTETVPMKIEIRTGGTDKLRFSASYQADFDPYERPLRLEHLFVPWAPSIRPPQSEPELHVGARSLEGDPRKGREIFFGAEANCARCHSFGDQGADVAADLTVSVHRDPHAVMKDIVQPNAAINPDYLSYAVQLKNGETMHGLIRSSNEAEITLLDASAQTHVIQRSDIDTIRTSSTSLMPEGFIALGPKKLQDLVAFLCSEDPVLKQKGLPTGVIRYQIWTDVQAEDLQETAPGSLFSEEPTRTGLLTRLEAPSNAGDHFSSRITGYLHPPQTGDYIFWLAADDHAEVWLSSNTKESDKTRILQLNRWTPSRQWENYPEQRSRPIHLEAGQRYYIEVRHLEETVDDCLAVG